MKKIVFNIKLGFITRIVSFKKLIFLYLFIRAIFKSLIFIYIYYGIFHIYPIKENNFDEFSISRYYFHF